MGTYVYNLRKKSTTIHTAEGAIQANHYSYAYKEWLGGSWDDAVERRRDAIRERASRVAAKAWMETDHEVCIFCGDKPQDGDEVCTDIRSSLWSDDTSRPAKLIGFLRRIGSRWVVQDRSPWEAVTVLSSPPRQLWRRLVAHEGIAVEETCGRRDGEEGTRWHVPGTQAPAIASRRIEVEIQVEY